jgi:NADH dehydrogenase
MKVAASWTFDLFLPPELVQLRLATTAGLTKEHFEPGEVVFHQGDIGDRLFILLSGHAEVVRHENGTEKVLAKLGAGESFGEMALLGGMRRNATVRCVAPMDVLCLPKREFGLLAAQLPALRNNFERLANERTPSAQTTPPSSISKGA